MRSERRLSFAIEAEGGLDGEGLAGVAAAGADILVAGPNIFNGGDPLGQLSRLVHASPGTRGASLA